MRCQPTWPEHRPIKIALVGEAPGEKEAEQGKVFVGSAGNELSNMLYGAGILREECFLTNVFMDRPENNDLTNFCLPTLKECQEIDPAYNHAAITKVGTKQYFLHPSRLGEIQRLKGELLEAKPNIVVALGNTPLWALTGQTKISSRRGTICFGGLVPFKVLPTYHPAYILRSWHDRPIAIADLMKALRESEFPEFRKPKREFWIVETLADVLKVVEFFITQKRYSVDIETAGGEITCIGFGIPEVAACIPFRVGKSWKSFWPTLEDEVEAWRMIKGLLLDNRATKVFQNGAYDMLWLYRKYGVTIRGNIEDTMLMHHSYMPEMDKDLGTLGSIYTNEASWKDLRKADEKLAK